MRVFSISLITVISILVLGCVFSLSQQVSFSDISRWTGISSTVDRRKAASIQANNSLTLISSNTTSKSTQIKVINNNNANTDTTTIIDPTFSTQSNNSATLSTSTSHTNRTTSSDNHVKTKTNTTTTTMNPTPPPYFPMPTDWTKQDEERYNTKWLVVSSKLQLAVTIIPKVMCSSVRAALSEKDCGDYKSRCAETRLRGGQAEEKFRHNMTRAIFLRDPFERVLSTYYNSDTNPYLHLPNCSSWKTCPIEDWVDYLYHNPDQAFRNEHFLPQARIAQFDKKHYHYRLRMTSKSDQDFFWKTLVQREPFGINQSKNSKATSKNTPLSQTKKMQQKFDKIPDPTILQILALYKDDFRLWEMAITQGSPKDPTQEYTMYDYYKEYLEEDLQKEYAAVFDWNQLSFSESLHDKQ